MISTSKRKMEDYCNKVSKIWEVSSCEPAVFIKHWSYLHKCPFGVLEYLKSRSADECEHYRHCI